jgi:hypothetical protein
MVSWLESAYNLAGITVALALICFGVGAVLVVAIRTYWAMRVAYWHLTQGRNDHEQAVLPQNQQPDLRTHRSLKQGRADYERSE